MCRISRLSMLYPDRKFRNVTLGHRGGTTPLCPNCNISKTCRSDAYLVALDLRLGSQWRMPCSFLPSRNCLSFNLNCATYCLILFSCLPGDWGIKASAKHSHPPDIFTSLFTKQKFKMYAFKPLMLLALPLLAVASPFTTRTGTTPCNTGNVQCCDKTVQGSDPKTLSLLQKVLGSLDGLLDLNLSGLIGLDCSAIDIVRVGGNSCSLQPVCCDGATFKGGLVSLGCTPININL
ncbi:fungal hydrophobin-domain-containing protein [Gymnopilus junonius]|uniref:Hydrophobin n=1 Tax=Gymnopilus junonius TaxID=109634 RepID=A0A9P5TT92_GYMJU|nr:fungal hydrophobin-domain-containing protein [Gymnopilus junonius]